MQQRSLLYVLSGLLVLSSLGLGYLSGRLYAVTANPPPDVVAVKAETVAAQTASVSSADLQQVLKHLDQLTQQLAQLPPQLQQAVAAALAEQVQRSTPVSATTVTPSAPETRIKQVITPSVTDTTWQNFLVSLGLVNYRALEATAERLFLGEQYDRSKAISALAVVGSPEVKAEIQRLILDEQESEDIRTAAIEAFDWQGQVNTLTQLLETPQSSSIQTAAVYAARNTQFNEVEQRQLEQTLFSQFQQTQDNTIREAIIDYFVTEPSKLEQLLSQSNAQGIKYIIRQHYGKEGV